MSKVQQKVPNDEIEILNARIKQLEAREKKLLNKLHVQEVIHEKILDALPMSIYLEDAEGRTLFANKTACEYNNKSREELKGMTVFDFFPEYAAKEQRAIDLEVWGSKKLIVNESLVEFNGEKMHIFGGKTIVQSHNDAYLLGFALDITSRVTAENLLKESEEKFRKLVEQAADCFILYNSKGQIVDVNEATCSCLRYSREELLLSSYKMITHFINDEIEHINNRLIEDSSYNFEHTMIRKDKTIIPVETNYSLICLGNETMILAWSRDISDRKKVEKQIKHMAYHDALTGLPNRWFVHDYLEKYLKNNKNNDKNIGVFLLDLDYFKEVNDCLGHQAGDMLLQDVARRLKSLYPEENTLARLGGDEFLLLVPELNNETDVKSISIGINEIMKIPFSIEGHELNISVSIGVSIYPRHGTDLTTLLKNADIALYRTKENGRSGYQIFT